MAHKSRRKARVLALQTLYAVDLRPDDMPEILFADIVSENPIRSDLQEYAKIIVNTVLKHIKDIDATIIRLATNWRIERMAVIDRNVLRMAIAELNFLDNVPEKVVIDEAVEIAKKYGADGSGKFINGIIDFVYKEKK